MSLEATLATWELTKQEVNSREKLLLLSLARRAGEEHTCWPSIKRMVEDTGLDRKTIIDIRQALIDKNLLKYTDRMVGRSGQIPEMQLLYVDEWEQKRNSSRLGTGATQPVDNSLKNTSTGTETGTGTSPKNGTGTSPENGTLNSKEEKVSRKKSFCASAQKKATALEKAAPEKTAAPETASPKTKEQWREENEKRHDFADKMDAAVIGKQQMENEARHIAEHEEIKRTPMPESLRSMIQNMKRGMGVGCHDHRRV